MGTRKKAVWGKKISFSFNVGTIFFRARFIWLEKDGETRRKKLDKPERMRSEAKRTMQIRCRSAFGTPMLRKFHEGEKLINLK